MQQTAAMPRILIVDDDPRILRALERLLRRNGFEVRCCAEAEAALAAVEAFQPFAVISDFKMPGENGLRFLARVRELLPTARRCLLTGYADVGGFDEHAGEGITFIPKPWSEAALVTEFLGRDS